ncbi:MAG: glycosyltransferase [Ruminococcaceae bacterium]|nr:glycosyltransferase [Oscillospiraceae bacterium]
MAINVDKYSADNSPLVSVIMPAYNAERFIKEAIASLQAQTHKNWELIVIDDGSKDSTCKILESVAEKDSRIRILKNEKNMGVAQTRNRGLEILKGDYAALLDSDDYWHPQMLSKMIARAEETKADIIYCSYEMVDEENKKLCSDFLVPEKTDFESSIVRSVITCSTSLITKEFAQSHRFPTGVYHEDIAMWFSALREGCTACGVKEVLAAYRQHPGSRSAGKIKSAKRRWAVYRKHLKLPFFKSVSTMIQYAYYGFIKFKRIN